MRLRKEIEKDWENKIEKDWEEKIENDINPINLLQSEKYKHMKHPRLFKDT